MSANTDLYEVFYKYEWEKRLTNGAILDDALDQGIQNDYNRIPQSQRLRVAQVVSTVGKRERALSDHENKHRSVLHVLSSPIRWDEIDMKEAEKSLDAHQQTLVLLQDLCQAQEILLRAYQELRLPKHCTGRLQQELQDSRDRFPKCEKFLENRRKGYAAELEIRRANKLLSLDGGHFKRLQARDRDKENFLSVSVDPSVFKGKWIGIEELGGGMSKAGLFVRYDEQGCIIDRIVRKDQWLSRDNWMSSRWWAGDPLNVDQRMPMECYLQRKCFDAGGSENIVEVRHWTQDHEKLIVRIYVAFCSYSDVKALMETYFGAGGLLPEPAVWHILETLADYCRIMEQCDDRTGKQVVHRDIKPANIFLDTPNPDRYPLWARPKLADFGLAFETYLGDQLNPVVYNNGGGTKGYLAPEMRAYVDANNGQPIDDFPLLAWTNIWGIGNVMLSIVNGRFIRGDDQLTYIPGSILEPQLNQNAHQTYSPQLLGLIQSCVQFKPEDRITVGDLQSTIEKLVHEGRAWNSYSYNARAGTQLQNERVEYEVMYPFESYKLGSAISGEVRHDLDISDQFR